MGPRLYWNMHKLAFLLEKRADEALKEQLDIGFAQYKVIEAINQKTLAKQNEVARMLDQTEASISRQIRILQAKGMIKVTDVMGNRRARELSLTHVGEENVSQAQDIIELTHADIFGTLSQQEQQMLEPMFDKMIDKLKKD